MLAPGALLQDRYLISGAIAQGGMGAVYQAIDQRLGHTVAVKQVLRDDPMLRQAFEQEARLLAALRHPVLPKVTDHFVEPAGQFLVMEFVPGDDLATLALRQREPLAVEKVLQWADQLLDALTYLHRQTPPVIHRDIKPQNLKLNAAGGVMLLDFGLAKGAPGQTAERSLVGYTLHYAAPEQVRGDVSDARSDLYALAATLYDLLAAAGPPNALQRLAAQASGQADPLLPLTHYNPALPPGLAAAIHQALALAPAARFVDAAAMRGALHAAGGDATQIVAPADAWAASTPAHNLPVQLTSFVAREAEVATVQQRLAREQVRLVTLTGPGGIGKTRLALAIATRCLPDFDGVYMVPLAAITDPALVLPAIAQTLELHESASATVLETLARDLRERSLLLVLDNFEQVVAAAPEISALLAAAPRVKLLVTGREALQIRGEHDFPVPALDLPDLQNLPALHAMNDYAAIRLFVQRAQAAKPDFVLSEGNAAAVAALCKRLDGLPLALELAAAAVKFFSVPTILARLSERLELPAPKLRDVPDRQRTLAASIRWSYDLLAPEEQALFRRLSLLAGSFTLEAAQALCTGAVPDEFTLFDTLAALVGKSLVKSLDDGGAEPRFMMLETIREFGRKQLESAGELERARSAHADYFARLAQEAQRHIWGAGMAQWVHRLEGELENLRAALAYYLEHPHGAEAALQLSGSLWRFWEIRGLSQEGRAWLDRALLRRNEAPPVSCWLPLHGAGNLANNQGDYATATKHYHDSLELLQALLPTLQDPTEIHRIRYAIGNTWLNLGHTAMEQSYYAQAVAHSQEAIAIYRALLSEAPRGGGNFQVGMTIATTNLGMITRFQGDYAQAEAYCTESLARYRELGDERGIGWNLHTLASVMRDRGDYAQAAQLYEEAKALFIKLSNQADIIPLYFDLGELARLQGQWDEAAAHYWQGLSLAQAVGNRKESANMLDRLSMVARREGDLVTAARLNEESLTIHRTIDHLLGLSEALLNRGLIALAQQEFGTAAGHIAESLQLKVEMGERKGIVDLLKVIAALMIASRGDAIVATRLVAAAETLRGQLGLNVPPVAQDEDTATLRAIHALVDKMAFALAWMEGKNMSLDKAVAEAAHALKQVA